MLSIEVKCVIMIAVVVEEVVVVVTEGPEAKYWVNKHERWFLKIKPTAVFKSKFVLFFDH